MRFFYLLIILSSIISCENYSNSKLSKEKSHESKIKERKTSEPTPKKEILLNDQEYKIITQKDVQLGWGYQILKKNKLIITQKQIPAIQGNFGFISEEESKLVANLVIQKMSNGEFPPSITIEELNRLGIHY
jgi:hypothetical protein